VISDPYDFDGARGYVGEPVGADAMGVQLGLLAAVDGVVGGAATSTASTALLG
jgi:hypothetical protein